MTKTIETTPKNLNKPKKSWILKTIAISTAMLFPTMKWLQAETAKVADKNETNISVIDTKSDSQESTYQINPEIIDKDSNAIDYLKNNLLIKWTPITDQKLGATFEVLWNDEYKISYNHEFEWIQNYSEPSSKKIEIKAKFTYKNNNTYITFESVNIWKYNLEKIWELTLKNTIYDYNVVDWENKTWYLNSKANKYKTYDMVENKIKEKTFDVSKTFAEIKEFENTQLTPLNELKVWEEVFQEWENYYREVSLTENWKYRPVAKLYFDKYGKFDANKTNDELKKNSVKILWVDVYFNMTDDKQLTMDKNCAKNLIRKVQSDRKALIKLVDQAKIWPNTDFTGFNKEKWVRAWSEWKDIWLFNTQFISVDLINNEYNFQRWKDKKQTLWFVVNSTESWESSISMVNWNHQNVNTIYTTTNNGFFRINLAWDVLSIEKIKKEWTNITEQLPEYQWDNLAKVITNKTNNYYNWSALEYYDENWNVVSIINCKKEHNWTFSIEKQSTNIQIDELYNSKKFNSLTKEIKKLWDKLGILNIDIMNDFSTLLAKNWINLNNQNVIRVNNKWEISYCTIDKKYNIQLDQKLYDWAEKILNTIKERLSTIEKINKRKILWLNNGQKQDFEKFVWWSRWIGKRLVPENDVNNFVSWNTDKISADILRWKWEESNISYTVSNNWSIKLQKISWKKEITISWQTYKIKVDKESWDIILDPIETKK